MNKSPDRFPSNIFAKSCVHQLRIMVQAFTSGQKQGIVGERERLKAAGESCSQPGLALWAKNGYLLQQVPNQATISWAL